MTEMLYRSDSYLQEFEAVTTDVDTEAGTLALDRSAFFPGGGDRILHYAKTSQPSWYTISRRR